MSPPYIHDHIAEDSLFYAKRVTEALVQRTVDLDQLPRKVYKIKSDDLIIVLAVIHKRQHLEQDDVPRTS
ncbi:MAG: hypothetical protein V3U65_19415 [Granulosicoccaceae bacterium]